MVGLAPLAMGGGATAVSCCREGAAPRRLPNFFFHAGTERAYAPSPSFMSFTFVDIAAAFGLVDATGTGGADGLVDAAGTSGVNGLVGGLEPTGGHFLATPPPACTGVVLTLERGATRLSGLVPAGAAGGGHLLTAPPPPCLLDDAGAGDWLVAEDADGKLGRGGGLNLGTCPAAGPPP